MMSFFKSAFSFKKSRSRQYVSRSPIKLPADELYRDLGAKCECIDVKVGDKKIIFDIENGNWDTANAENLSRTLSSTGSVQRVRKQVETLQEENNILKIKIEVLLNLIAEASSTQ